MSNPSLPSPAVLMGNGYRRLALVGMSAFVVLVGSLHFLQPEANPLIVPVSDYVLGPWGWLMTLAFVSLAVGSWALYQGIRQTAAWRSWRTGNVCMGLWIGGVTVAGIFPTDAITAPVTWHGAIHGFAATIAIGSLIVAEIAMARRPVGQPLRWLSPLIGGLAIASLLPNFLTGDFGLFERLIIALHVAWLMSLTLVGSRPSSQQ